MAEPAVNVPLTQLTHIKNMNPEYVGFQFCDDGIRVVGMSTFYAARYTFPIDARNNVAFRGNVWPDMTILFATIVDANKKNASYIAVSPEEAGLTVLPMDSNKKTFIRDNSKECCRNSDIFFMALSMPDDVFANGPDDNQYIAETSINKQRLARSLPPSKDCVVHIANSHLSKVTGSFDTCKYECLLSANMSSEHVGVPLEDIKEAADSLDLLTAMSTGKKRIAMDVVYEMLTPQQKKLALEKFRNRVNGEGLK